MDASDLAQQTLQSSAAKALKARSLAREYRRYGFTTVRDLRSMDPECYGSDWIARWHRASGQVAEAADHSTELTRSRRSMAGSDRLPSDAVGVPESMGAGAWR